MAYLRPSWTGCGLLGSKSKALPRLVGKSKHTTPVTLRSVYRAATSAAVSAPTEHGVEAAFALFTKTVKKDSGT
jgi:hypothetical protein